jgi:hypothetical protein
MCISSLCALLFFVYPILALLFRPFRYFVTLTVPLVVCCRYLNKDKVTVNDFRIWNNNGWVVPNSGRVVLGSWGRLDLNPSISGVSGYIMGHGKDSKNQNSFCMTNKNSTIFSDNIRSIYSLLTAYLFIYTPFLSKWFVVWFVCLRYFEICEVKGIFAMAHDITGYTRNGRVQV